MKRRFNFFGFWLLLSLCTATTMFNSCSKKDDIGSNNPTTSDKGIVINGVNWATCNVDKPGTFVAKPEATGMFYKWNSKVGWSAFDPIINSNGDTTWDGSSSSDDKWETANDPSPAGWRVPTSGELLKLFDTDKVSQELATVNGIDGTKFTDIATGKSIFLPATGYRDQYYYGGALQCIGTFGYYWGGTFYDIYPAHGLVFLGGYAVWYGVLSGSAFSVRPVTE